MRTKNVCSGPGALAAAQVASTSMALNGGAFIGRHRLAGQPIPATGVEQVSMRTFRDQVDVKDGMYLVLDPRPVPDNLVAPRH
ncbi:MAG: hypothetical protein AB7E55_32525 [Pigmentiphaga sp.]